MSSEGIRDRLAAERTYLANERTFLAYVRTGLALCAGGIAFFEFFQSSGSLPIGYVLLVSGSATVVVGVVRFFRTRRRIGQVGRETD